MRGEFIGHLTSVHPPPGDVASRPLLDFFAYLSPAHSGARKFYDELTANFRTDGEDVLHRYLTDNSMILEQRMTGTLIGSMLGLPGHGRRISFRILHVFEFRDGLTSIQRRDGVGGSEIG
jgi:hypothetical protein